MLRLLKSFFSKAPAVPLPAKDPMDWTLTPSSKEWHTDQYCPNCKHFTGHRERMADICNNCGHHGDMGNYRSWREIWDGSKWRVQFKYGNKPEDQVIK
jgi:acetyl-CoA carboxylase beta subunit